MTIKNGNDGEGFERQRKIIIIHVRRQITELAHFSILKKIQRIFKIRIFIMFKFPTARYVSL